MRKSPPTAVIVIAILHFMFALTCLGIGVFQGLNIAGVVHQFEVKTNPQEAHLQKRVDRMMEEKVFAWKEYNIIAMVFPLTYAGILTACGIGLLLMQPWARIGSVLFAVLAILQRLTDLVYTFIFVVPLLHGIFEQAFLTDPGTRMGVQEARAAAHVGTVTGVVMAVLSTLLAMVYPVVVIIVMCLPSVRRYFRPRPARRRLEVDDDERDDYDFHRQRERYYD